MKKIFLTLCLLGAAFVTHAQNAYTQFSVRYTHHPEDVKHYDTSRLRKEFMIDSVFVAGQVRLTYSLYDRFIAGGAMPIGAPLHLDAIAPLRTAHFLDNRELGIINIGGDGVVTVDGKKYDLKFREALYIGRGAYDITFSSANPDTPAKFYLNSATAHTAYPIKKITLADAKTIKAGSAAESNQRTIYQLIIDGVAGVRTCQLQMGMTILATGSVWNTMPPHTHLRRMETYLYFDLPQNQQICHIMGEPQETRPMWLHNEQAVISPQWSIHCAAGTASYSFIWGMAGENLDYGDMQKIQISDLK